MANTSLIIGELNNPLYTFYGDDIESLTTSMATSLIGDELSYDTLEASIFYAGADLEDAAPFGTPVFYLVSGSPVQKFFVADLHRAAGKKYRLEATSAIGILDREKFYGGIYNGETLKDVVTDIMTSNGVQLYKAYSRFQTVLASGETLIPGAKLSENYYGYADINSVLHAKLKFWSFDWQSSNASSSDLRTDTVLLGAKGSNSGTRYYLSLYVRRSTSSERYTTSGDLTFYHNGRSINLGQVNLGDVLEIEVRPFDGKLYFTKNGSKRSYTIYSSTTSNPIPIYVVGAGYSTNTRDVTSGFLCDWYFYKVYNGLGEELINAVALKNKYTGEVYIKNLATGYTTAYSSAKVNDSDVTRIKTNDIAVYSASDIDYQFAASAFYGEGADELQIYGWLPITSKREALHQILFANNLNLLQTEQGEYAFTKISTSAPQEIDDDDVYNAGERQRPTRAKSISVTEHSYSESQTGSEMIFDNTNEPVSSGEYLATFQKAPISGAPVAANGLTILSYNCNAAIVRGRGSITGTPYDHSTAEIVAINESILDGEDRSVPNMTLVTPVVSDNVINKLKAFYFEKITVWKSDIVFRGEKCGSSYSFLDAFGDKSDGILTQVSINASSISKGRFEFVSGYVPPDKGGYTDYVILTDGQTWEVPQSVLDKTNPTIRLNIIGRGQDGANGEAGENGTLANGTTPGKGGKGGRGGQGGSGGKIYTVTVDVGTIRSLLCQQQSDDFVVKTRNAGGSTINTYSSATGNSMPSGFVNVMSGERYAYPGRDGVDGGEGGDGGYYDPINISTGQKVIPEAGESVSGNAGGRAGRELADFWYEGDELRQLECGGPGGGGASYAARGGNAISSSGRPSGYNPDPNSKGGDGADGGTAEQAPKYGCGGNGGNGAGGGGGAEVIAIGCFSPDGDYQINYSGTAGVGGLGGSASTGAAGCCILFF